MVISVNVHYNSFESCNIDTCIWKIITVHNIIYQQETCIILLLGGQWLSTWKLVTLSVPKNAEIQDIIQEL